MTVVGLVAYDAATRGIGRDGRLAWQRLDEDMRRFSRTTRGKTVVMGMNTYRGIGGPLPARTNVVVTSKKLEDAPGVVFVDMPEAFRVCRILGNDTDVFVIGGSSVYRQMAGMIDEWRITEVSFPEGTAPVAYDSFFDVNLAGWRETQRETVREAGGQTCVFRTLVPY